MICLKVKKHIDYDHTVHDEKKNNIMLYNVSVSQCTFVFNIFKVQGESPVHSDTDDALKISFKGDMVLGKMGNSLATEAPYNNSPKSYSITNENIYFQNYYDEQRRLMHESYSI